MREQLKKLLVKFQVPKISSEGKNTLPPPVAPLSLLCVAAFLELLGWAGVRQHGVLGTHTGFMF